MDRAREMVDKLAALGLPVDWERVVELAQGSVGRPHIAQAMVEKGYIAYPQDAFVHYLGRNGLAYAERDKLSPAGAVSLIIEAGGLPALAHPREVDNVQSVLPEMKEAGLVGIEVYYETYTPPEVEAFAAMADREGADTLRRQRLPCLGTPRRGRARDRGTPAGDG